MNEVIQYLQNAGAIAFVLLGVAVAYGWSKRRDSSLGFLALAIVLLAVVSGLGRIPHAYTPPLLPQISLLLFMGSGYALLLFRGSLIPLSKRWHIAAVAVMVVVSAGYLVTQALVAAKAAPVGVMTTAGVVLILVWSATVVEPIVRFWLVARDLPAVQAWRLRALSFGFGGLVAILLFAIASLAFTSSPIVQILIELAVLAIVPLLYVSFAPPSWLRRQWRASEEDGLQAFMQDMLLLSEEPAILAERALEWAMRLVGGAAAALFDGEGHVTASKALDSRQLYDLGHLQGLDAGLSRVEVGGAERALFVLPISSVGSVGRLVVLAGPFTPGFGGDELSRVQQFMTAVAAAIDRAQLLDRLKTANVELVDANHHKTLFLANMSHELRTPLNAILGFSELLIDEAKGQFPDETRKRFLTQIYSSGKHLLGLINDILDLSKVEAGQMELRLQVVGVEDLINQVVSTVEPLAAKKGIELESDASHAGQVLADEVKLRQMILNLASNGIKFTAEGGKVTIKAARVGDRLQILVEDNGIGIAEADTRRIFKEFQQVDSGANRKQQGTGLGLALTRSFAILHGGDVSVVSELGKGSRFTIDMPLEARNARPLDRPAPSKAAAPDMSRPLVIVVEDDPVAAELLGRQIERAGFRTMIARNGADAVELAKEHQPVVITLDILLPDVDGWDVLQSLKQYEATKDIPVVVVSVVDNPALGTALGALDYFVKPVDPKELVKRLNAYRLKPANGRRQKSVLVVDDEPANREWLKEVLEPAGFKAILAKGGQEAIDLARSHQPDVVMLDLVMPEVDGFEVVTALSQNADTRKIPIMVLTAKHLTEADIVELSGRVSTIVKRGTTGAVDLLGQLRSILKKNGH